MDKILRPLTPALQHTLLRKSLQSSAFVALNVTTLNNSQLVDWPTLSEQSLPVLFDLMDGCEFQFFL